MRKQEPLNKVTVSFFSLLISLPFRSRDSVHFAHLDSSYYQLLHRSVARLTFLQYFHDAFILFLYTQFFIQQTS